MPALPKPFPRQFEVLSIIKKAKRGTRTMIGYGGAMGGGKGLDVSTPIATPRGWTTMGELRPGDEVFAPDGSPTKVLWVSEVHHRQCYKVTLDDGAELIADDQHRWSIFSDMSPRVVDTPLLAALLSESDVRIARANIIGYKQAGVAEYRKVVSVTPVDSVPTVCIMVDHESHCFVAGRGLVTTHNSSLIAMLAVQYALTNPGANIVIARYDIVSLRPTTMARFYEYCPTHLEDGTKIMFSRDDNNKNQCKLRLPHWPPGVYSTVYFRGLADPKFFYSIELTALFIDEGAQIPEKNVLIALTRLRQRLPDGTLPKWLFLVATNPGASWFDDWFLDPDAGKMKALKEYSQENGVDIGSVNFVFSGPKDNPHTDDKYMDFMSAVLPDEMEEMYVKGDFGSYEGKIFTNFNPEFLRLTQADVKAYWEPEHLTDVIIGSRHLTIPKFDYAIGGLDFAGEQRNAHASTAGVRIVLPGKPGYARDIAIDDWAGKGPRVSIRQRDYMRQVELALHRRVDWVADKTQTTGVQLLRDQGFTIHYNEGGDNSWASAVQTIKDRFALNENGIPQSFYLDHMVEWEKEMTRYHLDPNPNGLGEYKEKPVRVGDDRVDWYRYSTEYLVKLGRQRRRVAPPPYRTDTRGKSTDMTLGDFTAMVSAFTKAG